MTNPIKHFHTKAHDACQVIEKMSNGNKTQVNQSIILAQFYDFAHEQAQRIEVLQAQVQFLESLNTDYVADLLEKSNEEEKALIKKLYNQTTSPETKQMLKDWANLVVQGLKISKDIKNR